MPTVFVHEKYRFYFFSREESRKHIHVSSSDGEAKIWLEPKIEVAQVAKLSMQEVNKILEIVKNREEEINGFWNRHFEKNG